LHDELLTRLPSARRAVALIVNPFVRYSTMLAVIARHDQRDQRVDVVADVAATAAKVVEPGIELAHVLRRSLPRPYRHNYVAGLNSAAPAAPIAVIHIRLDG
jgi:hypothetical protein